MSSFIKKTGTLITNLKKVFSDQIITGISSTKNDAKITIVGVKDRPGVAASIFKPLSKNFINVDMVVQNISQNGKDTFFQKEFTVSKLSDRMGMRLEGPKIENIVDTNIKSEGLIKGVIQVPADGNPIIMLSDHGTIGGYPKIGVVISADYDKLVQLTPGSKIRFKEVNLSSAETLFRLYDLETQNLISQI